MKRIFLLAIILSFSLVISACKPVDYQLFGNSLEAIYYIEISENLTAHVNLTFYYDADKPQKGLEIALPQSQNARLIYLGDEQGEIKDYHFKKIIKDGKTVSKEDEFKFKTHEQPPGRRWVNILYQYPLNTANKIYLESDPSTRETLNQSSGEALLKKAGISPLWDAPGVKKTFEIYFPQTFYPYYALVEMVEPEGTELAEVDTAKKAIRFSTKGWMRYLDVEFVADLEEPSRLQIGETEHFIVASVYEEANWFKERVEPYYPVITQLTGLPSPYKKHLAVIDSEPPTFDSETTLKISHPVPRGGIFLTGLIFPELAIHETTHVYLEFLDKFNQTSWFNEGSATYTQKLMVDYDLKFIEYNELKKLYETNHVFDQAWSPSLNREKYPINYYMYGAFIIDGYIQEYGLEAMHKVYLRLKELSAGCEGRCYSHKDIIKVMIETSGKPITEEDILYPYKKLFLTNKSLFLQKVEPLVKDIYCYGEGESLSCSAPSDNW